MAIEHRVGGQCELCRVLPRQPAPVKRHDGECVTEDEGQRHGQHDGGQVAPPERRADDEAQYLADSTAHQTVQRGEEGHPREPGLVCTCLNWTPWVVGAIGMPCVVAAVLGVRGCVHGRLQSGLRDACSFNLDTMGMSSPTHRRQPEGYRLPVGAMHQEPSGRDEAIRRHSTRRSPACNQHPQSDRQRSRRRRCRTGQVMVKLPRSSPPATAHCLVPPSVSVPAHVPWRAPPERQEARPGGAAPRSCPAQPKQLPVRSA